ncbi:MAG: hypothetical protein KBF74_05740 [Ferruginibacter sp.]|jgi:hypothetical protein|nr:hypothetical protein [Ferruginibacter sp.]
MVLRKHFVLFLLASFFMLPGSLTAQEITYSEFNNEDNRDIRFEILGKMDEHYIIYKNIRWKHVLAFYDKDMRIKKSLRLTFIPDKTFNIDFITYPGHFLMIYQYQKNNVIYCMGVKMGPDGKKIDEPVQLDSTKLGILSDNKIYSTIYSQDKQKILVYKMQRKNQQFTVATKLFDTSMQMLDSTRMVAAYDDRYDAYSDINLSNDGSFIFAKLSLINYRKKVNGMDIISHKPGAGDFVVKPLSFENKFFDEVKIKLDNLNRNCIITSLYYDKQGGNIKGLFAALIDLNDAEVKKMNFNEFHDTLRVKISDGQFRSAFDNLLIQQTIVKKDGGFILSTEDSYSQGRSGPSNSSWDRYNYLYSSPYTTNTDYYMTNPAYNNGFYRPLSSFNSMQNIRFYYDNIMLLSVNNDMVLQWSTIIPKKQADDDNDNFLSYCTMNVGSEIHFIFVEEDRNKQVISNHSVFPDGQLKRYPTLKSREAGFEFMPRLAKQVGYREMIIPCVYRTNIAFAKVIFFE